ncbi:MAG: reverse transcriptase family protein [Gammaproteobacteria bacterium]
MPKTHVVDFRAPNTLDEIAVALGIDRSLLARIVAAAASPQAQSSLYIRHQIPKKRGKIGEVRVVWDVSDSVLRDAHRAFARRFGNFAHDVDSTFPHPAAYGYIRGKSIKDNAAQHCGRRMLLRADIEDFFASISRERLIGRFLQLGIQREAAEILAAFATIDGRLALGLNGSPMLANLVCSRLDTKLQRLSVDNACVYTRYADDIAISGENLPYYESVAGIVEGEGFRLARKKFRITKNGQAHFVTGLSVSDPVAPHVPRRFKRRLRQELYYCRTFGIGEHLKKIEAPSYQKGINRIDGSVRFTASIETKHAELLRKTWSDALAAESATVSYALQHNMVAAEATLLVDEAELERDGNRLLAIACVTTEQIDLLKSAAIVLLRQHQVDPFSPGRKGTLKSKGLHFADAPEELRYQFVALLAYLPFRGYLAFGSLEKFGNYEQLYLALLNSILPRRFRDYDRARLTLLFEQNPRISRGQLEGVVRMLYDDHERRNERRPIVCPAIVIGTKQDQPAISIPDFLLGVFSRYFGSAPDERSTDRLRFERLRDKFRHIANIDTGEVFSRRHPLDV